jgi:hypothetical protein
MKLSPSWETPSCSATQEFPKILRNPKVHYCVRMNISLALIPRQINAVHTTLTNSSEIHLNIILYKHNRSGMVAVLGPFEALPCYIHTYII